MNKLVACFVVIFTLSIVTASTSNTPEQVHLSLGGQEGDYVVTWVTQNATLTSILRCGYEAGSWTQFIAGDQDVFVDGGWNKRRIYIHRVTLKNLPEKRVVYYQVGSASNDESDWSQIFKFRTLPRGSTWSPRFAVYGDMGLDNARSMPSLLKDANGGELDMVLHVGDFAYDMHNNDSKVGDAFMRMIEPLASQLPYMTCPGNHERAYNFSNYRRRFSMPGGDGEGQFFSFNVGPAHIISYNTEFYYYVEYGWKQIANQYKWLENDLKIANLPENRKQRPWLIVMAHRPMYCTNYHDMTHCFNPLNFIRKGIPILPVGTFLFGLEELFYKNGVDLMLWAHEHSYERMWPLYNREVCNGTMDRTNPYFNPPAPVHVVIGSAGNRENEDRFSHKHLPWSAFRTSDYGYTRMTIWNGTHLTLDQLSVDRDSATELTYEPTLVDSVTYVREKHGAGVFHCPT